MVNHQPAEQMFKMKLILAWQAWQREKSHRYVLIIYQGSPENLK